MVKIAKNVYQLRIDFNVTPAIKRFVYIYVIDGKTVTLIDTGVAGSEKIISDFLFSIGKSILDVKNVFLTHAHPDHIGSAARLKELCNCQIYASKQEAEWIEDICKQYEERPIPNFYKLVNKSVKIDHYIMDNEVISIDDYTITAYLTAGHSVEGMSFYYNKEKVLFTGDAIPASHGLPIFINYLESIKTLDVIMNINNVKVFCSAWDNTFNKKEIGLVIKEAKELLMKIYEAANSTEFDLTNKDAFISEVCKKIHMEGFIKNPLFINSVFACLKR